MKLNRRRGISIPQSFTLSMFITFLLLAVPSGLAQSPTPAPEVKLLSIRIESKASTRLEIVSIPSNNNLRPTEAYVYRPEISKAPMAGNQYEQYERRPVQTKYVVLRVTNEGARTIKSIDWEYTSPHFKGDKIIFNRQTTSKLKIGNGQTAALSKKLTDEHNCWMSSGSILGQQAIGQNCGRKNTKWTGMHPLEARLLKITYEDGTVWNARP
jgi:hypothetical protein